MFLDVSPDFASSPAKKIYALAEVVFGTRHHGAKRRLPISGAA
jgi:hypothetical protein